MNNLSLTCKNVDIWGVTKLINSSIRYLEFERTLDIFCKNFLKVLSLLQTCISFTYIDFFLKTKVMSIHWRKIGKFRQAEWKKPPAITMTSTRVWMYLLLDFSVNISSLPPTTHAYVISPSRIPYTRKCHLFCLLVFYPLALLFALHTT